MANIFSEVDNALVDAGKFITGAATKFATLFSKEKALAAPVAASVVTLVSDVEALIALSSSVVGASGLNFPADSAAFTQFLKVKADVVSAAALLEEAVKAL